MDLINVIEIFSLLTSAFTILFMLISSIYKANDEHKLIQSLINDGIVKEEQPKTVDGIVENILKRNERNYNANNKRKSSAYELHNMDKMKEINADRKKMQEERKSSDYELHIMDKMNEINANRKKLQEERKLITVKTFDIHEDELPNKLINKDNLTEVCLTNPILNIEEIKKRYGNNVCVCRHIVPITTKTTKENTVEEASSESTNDSN